MRSRRAEHKGDEALHDIVRGAHEKQQLVCGRLKTRGKNTATNTEVVCGRLKKSAKQNTQFVVGRLKAILKSGKVTRAKGQTIRMW